MIHRKKLEERVKAGLESSPITALLGPRQCGKTTLAHELYRRMQGQYFDLENPRDLQRLQQPQTVLEAGRGLVVIDEIQRRAELLPLLRVLADRRPQPCQFLLLGSASPDLVKNASETLAGRVHFIEMSGFTIDELGTEQLSDLWVRGGFPRSFLAADADASFKWREDFIQTFLERDLPQMGVTLPAQTMRRFWTMLAHHHGHLWNASEIGASFGVSHHTARRYLDTLSGAYMVRQLQPWFENVGKRLVKSPKVYLRDSGLFHALLQIPDLAVLQAHPKLGASWEGFLIEHIVSWAGERNAWFWATHSRAELDLLLLLKGKRWGIEFKYQDAPAMTRSMHVALQDLKLERLWVVYPGPTRYDLHERVECVPVTDLDRIRLAVS